MKNFLVSAAVFFGVCIIYFVIMTSKTEGNFTYLLDDAYIHLALAKNFALHGVWGMTPHEFSSSSSSPVFTFLISLLMRIFGNSALIPLVINLLCAVGILCFLTKYFRRFLDQDKFLFCYRFFLRYFRQHYIFSCFQAWSIFCRFCW